jgi:hypothetical protein
MDGLIVERDGKLSHSISRFTVPCLTMVCHCTWRTIIETVVYKGRSLFHTLCQHLCGDTEENCRKSYSTWVKIVTRDFPNTNQGCNQRDPHFTLFYNVNVSIGTLFCGRLTSDTVSANIGRRGVAVDTFYLECAWFECGPGNGHHL